MAMDEKPSRPPSADPPAADALSLLNSLLERSLDHQVPEPQLMLILDALAGASDPALAARFPAVLAICARQGVVLDSQGLLARYWEANPRRQILEKLLIVSAELFHREAMALPRNLDKIAESLKAKHPGLSSAGELRLHGGARLAVAEMRAALRRFAEARRAESAPAPAAAPEESAPQLEGHLRLLFSDKQAELVFKRLKREPFTKTEREYFSRVVRKKLAAIADPEIQALAGRVLQRPKRGPG
jgi:hypothetical protein